MQTLEEYKSFLETLKKQTGLDMLTPDESGLVTMRVDDKYNVSLQFVAPSGKILCFVEIRSLPPDAPKALYRDLLAGGLFGVETAGGYFTLEEQTETVIYNYFFDGDAAAQDPEDFISTLEKLLQLCDIWADRIQGFLDVAPETGDGFHAHLASGMILP